MRSRYLIVVAGIGLIGSLNAAAADTTDASQTAVWTSRELQFLGSAYLSPGVMDSGEPLVLSRTSSDQLYAQVRFVLRQLGARSIDLDSRGCWPLKLRPCVDVKFTVLAANDQAGKHVLSAPVGAHWQLVQLGGNCDLLDRATRTVLPFFVTRNVKLISRVDCERLHVGLRAEVLKPSSELASTD